MELAKQTCKPCEGGIPPMDRAYAQKKLVTLSKGWELSKDGLLLQRTFSFADFSQGMGFVNTVAAIAEEQGHHPEIHIHDYKFVSISLSTHAINGLSINDFIVAAKIDAIKEG